MLLVLLQGINNIIIEIISPPFPSSHTIGRIKLEIKHLTIIIPVRFSPFFGSGIHPNNSSGALVV